MATKKVGELIKEARTKAGLSQSALAEQIEGLSASDVGKAERGEKELSQAVLKAIAKLTGVTQKSLLEAPKGGASASASTAAKKTSSTGSAKTSGTSAAKKTSSTSSAKTSGTSAAKKTSSTGSAKTSGTSTAKKTSSSSSAKKTSSAKTAATTSVELTSAEKTMLNAYRKADAETRKAALNLLKGEKEDILSTLLQSFTSGNSGGSGGLLELLGNLGKK